MINSENIVFTNNATSKNAISKSILMTYGYKSVELKIIKDTISMYQNSFMEKEKVLKEEKQKLVFLYKNDREKLILFIYNIHLAKFVRKIFYFNLFQFLCSPNTINLIVKIKSANCLIFSIIYFLL